MKINALNQYAVIYIVIFYKARVHNRLNYTVRWSRLSSHPYPKCLQYGCSTCPTHICTGCSGRSSACGVSRGTDGCDNLGSYTRAPCRAAHGWR